ncbi:MAG: cupredoxin domain-containing protein [Patescibacteria group bacterium]
MKQKSTIILIVVIVLAFGGWYYFSQNPPASIEDVAEPVVTEETPTLPPGGMETGEIKAEVMSEAPTARVKEFTITGSNFSFAPVAISARAGDRVKITFVNSGGMHDFKIDEFNVATSKIGGGESAVVEFVADKVGSFEYYCSVGSHRSMGMWGTLVVTE